MKNKKVPPLHKEHLALNRFGVNTILREFAMWTIVALLLFLVGGDVTWLNTWIFLGWKLCFSTIYTLSMIKWNVELLNIRGRPTKALRSGHMREYDKIFFVFYTPLFILFPIIVGLEYRLLPGSSLPCWLVLVGLFFIILGDSIFGWAIVVNRFFHGIVKIQTDRGHSVVSSGPYKYVRHPGYLGQILYYLGFPVLFESKW
ncbi:MAG: isoprenylcysteine carboxylmethyltransferase family protein, partial [Candidatus Korarchaeota archaeon]|nr:isoprenylcysteine carboxylmethyltransferase family protein [Candidatus Korarchaeota archaeon]NIU85714.1 hypothetical protein [Candidatus Thorarchaeota archaeon]NIW14939.1 hypothetical protein [Candidatus Thorarchaeota archaeon]NIW52979.1 hypothetical protein [Candidatus Korarchaeota archaeon]